VVKPFSPKELVARVKAVLRRHEQQQEPSMIEIGDIITIDIERHEILVKGKKIELTPTEFNILRILASKPSWLFSREQLLNQLWGNEKIVIDRTIDVHIKNLREKLGPAGKIVVNVRGVGYKIDA
jgi:DNA-binding response OmpR family regulator